MTKTKKKTASHKTEDQDTKTVSRLFRGRTSSAGLASALENLFLQKNSFKSLKKVLLRLCRTQKYDPQAQWKYTQSPAERVI